MQATKERTARCARFLLLLAALAALPIADAMAAELDIFHADSLAGPMRELKKAFEAKHPGVTINLTSGVSKLLAARILKGDPCDVFAPSSPAVIEEDLMNKHIAGSGKDAASWYVVFSANEMVIITARGNPLGIRQANDGAGHGQRGEARQSGRRDRVLLGGRRGAQGCGHRSLSRERQYERSDPLCRRRPGNGPERGGRNPVRGVSALPGSTRHPEGNRPAARGARDSKRRRSGGGQIGVDPQLDEMPGMRAGLVATACGRHSRASLWRRPLALQGAPVLACVPADP